MFKVQCLEGVKKQTKKQTILNLLGQRQQVKKKPSNLLFYILIMHPHLVYFLQFWSLLCPTNSKNKIEPQKSLRKAKKVNKMVKTQTVSI